MRNHTQHVGASATTREREEARRWQIDEGSIDSGARNYKQFGQDVEDFEEAVAFAEERDSKRARNCEIVPRRISPSLSCLGGLKRC